MALQLEPNAPEDKPVRLELKTEVSKTIKNNHRKPNPFPLHIVNHASRKLRPKKRTNFVAQYPQRSNFVELCWHTYSFVHLSRIIISTLQPFWFACNFSHNLVFRIMAMHVEARPLRLGSGDFCRPD